MTEFSGGDSGSNAGALPLRQVEQRTGILRRLMFCLADRRNLEQFESTVKQQVAQRVYRLAPGVEDWYDPDELRRNALPALLAGNPDWKVETAAEEAGSRRRVGGL